MFCVDNIKYEHLEIISNLKSCYMYEPSQHLTVTNEGSFFAEFVSLSFGT